MIQQIFLQTPPKYMFVPQLVLSVFFSIYICVNVWIYIYIQKTFRTLFIIGCLRHSIHRRRFLTLLYGYNNEVNGRVSHVSPQSANLVSAFFVLLSFPLHLFWFNINRIFQIIFNTHIHTYTDNERQYVLIWKRIVVVMAVIAGSSCCMYMEMLI